MYSLPCTRDPDGISVNDANHRCINRLKLSLSDKGQHPENQKRDPYSRRPLRFELASDIHSNRSISHWFSFAS